MTKSKNNTPTQKVEIRQSKISDVEEINELERKLFSSKMRYGPSLILAIINTSLPHLALTAELKPQNNVIGFIAGEIEESFALLGRIITIEVDLKFQHQLIGELLLSAFEQNIKSHYSVQTLELQVHFENHKAINFYRKHGFREIKKLKNYYSRKEHAILMQKTLI
ncbi:MAG: GNAT family N-acetyltransferase [Candidatus Hodarchaeales archaeon]|jgi:ribosomal-protein-alanine N-acetyltransferase